MTVIAMSRGTSRLVEIDVRDENGDPLDLTNGKAVFWVGNCIDSTGDDVVIEKETPTEIGLTETDGLWTVSVPILPVDTNDLPPRASYYYECRVWDAQDNEYVVAGDRFELDPSLTVTAPTP